MDWITFLYELIGRHCPVNESQIQTMKMEAKEWYESKEIQENKFGKMFHTHASKWYTRTALALLFVFAQRWMYDVMNPYEETE